MSDYTQTTEFGPKDDLASGNPAKLILGTDIDTELSNIATAIATKYDSSSIATGPVGFASGTAALPSVYLGDDTTSGFYRPAANQIALALDASNVLTVTGTGTTWSVPLTAPSLAVTSATVPANGLYLAAANTVALAANSTLALEATDAAVTSLLPLTVTGPTLTGATLTVSSSLAGFQNSGDLLVKRDGSTANSAGEGPSLQLLDSSSGGGAAILQASGNQIELWTLLGGTWYQGLYLDNDATTYIRDHLSAKALKAGYRGVNCISVGSNLTLTDDYNGAYLILDGSVSISIPDTLESGFTCMIDSNTYAGTLVDVNSNLYWLQGGSYTGPGNRSLEQGSVVTVIVTPSNGVRLIGSGLS